MRVVRDAQACCMLADEYARCPACTQATRMREPAGAYLSVQRFRLEGVNNGVAAPIDLGTKRSPCNVCV